MGSSLKDNRDLACYFITKHSWKGKYVFATMFSYFCLFCVFLAPLLACSSGAYSIGYSRRSPCRQTFF